MRGVFLKTDRVSLVSCHDADVMQTLVGTLYRRATWKYVCMSYCGLSQITVPIYNSKLEAFYIEICYLF